MSSLTRRATLAATVLAVSGAAERALAAATAKPAPLPVPPDATELARRIQKREISALEAVDAAIARAQTLQPKLNALVTPMFERARDEAKQRDRTWNLMGGVMGPFAGVPFLIKDLNDVKGVPTRSGSRWTAALPPATAQDAYIDACEQAGLICIGKSATPEYGFLPTTEPLAFGPTRNP